MTRRKVLLIGAALAVLLLLGATVLWQRRFDNDEVRLTGLAAWNVGPNTVLIRKVEVGDWTWGGSVERPPEFLQPLFRRFPAILEWWASTHREYTLGLAEKEYVLVDVQVLGPNPQLVLNTLRLGVQTPDGLIENSTGRWTQVTGQPADLHATIEIPRGAEFSALQARMGDQRVTFPVRR